MTSASFRAMRTILLAGACFHYYHLSDGYLLPRVQRASLVHRFHQATFQPPLGRVAASTFSSKTDEEPYLSSSSDTEKPPPSTSTDEEEVVSSSTSSLSTDTDTTPNKKDNSSRLRRLKDLVWVRETLEDLTAAEFACSVEAHHQAETEDETPQKRRKRAVDYEKLLMQLNRRIQDLGCNFTETTQQRPSADGEKSAPFTCTLQPDVGLGTTAYTEKQRQLLLERLVITRQSLMDIFQGYKTNTDDGIDLPFSISLPDLRVEIPRETDENGNAIGPKLYVRDDGTVDWDGALQDQAALRKFGGAVWARINGRDPELLEGNNSTEGSPAAASSGHSHSSTVTARVIETAEIKSAREELNSLTSELNKMQTEHTALLNSVISAGQAVANVNLASLAPKERSKIVESADALEKMREKVSYQTLLYELERIYTYLAGELGNPQTTGYISLQDRLNVAEFGLLESQVHSFSRQLGSGDGIDADVLAVVMEQLNDFKRRLGIDYFVTGVSFDREAILRWLSELADQTKKGLAFYVKGVRLFWNDILFCFNLVSRAAQGYTLKPREVRTIRRTFKDFLTLIPFIIILIIPLTPVGHVLVFGAIQRFFPDFFPSCFTEQRQNLLQLYENAEYTEFSINENWREKLSRLVVAFFYFVANSFRAAYAKTASLLRNERRT